MKIQKFQDRDEWLFARRGKITGSRLKDIVVKRGTGEKIGFYELIAERLAVAPDEERPMDRGTRLEDEAMQRFMTETGKELDTSLVIWTRDDNESIAISPDGFNTKEAADAKCLSSAKHLEAFLTQEVPDEYKMQKLQYFIVNDELETLYFVFYDPRIPCKDFFYLTIHRKDVEKECAELLEYQKLKLKMVDDIVNKLSGF